MIGFPLRLLARENYDRVARIKGARAVALITGEEKIVPPNPAYFVCTVESMPLDRPSSSWPSTRFSSAATPSAAMSSPTACSMRAASRDHVPRRRHDQAAAEAAGARGRVRRRGRAFRPCAIPGRKKADAPAAAQRRRRFRRRRCLRAGRGDPPPARRHARW